MTSTVETALYYVAQDCNRITAINLRSIQRFIDRNQKIGLKVIVFYREAQRISKLHEKFEKFSWRRLRDFSTMRILTRIIFARTAERVLVFSDNILIHNADFIPLLNFVRQKNFPVLFPAVGQCRFFRQDTSLVREMIAYFDTRASFFTSTHLQSTVQHADFTCAMHIKNLRFVIWQMPRARRFTWYKELKHRFHSYNLRLFMADAGINHTQVRLRTKLIRKRGAGMFSTVTGLFKAIEYILREKNSTLKIPVTEWLFPVAQLSFYLYVVTRLAGVHRAEALLYCALLFSFPWFFRPNGFRKFWYFIPDLFLRLLRFPVL